MRAVIAALALLTAALTASAEEIELVSGERLTGRIARHTDQIVTLDHAILGTLEIPRSAVRSIDGEPLSPVEVHAEPPDDEVAQAAEPPEAAAEPAPPKPRPKWRSQVELGMNARQATTDDANLRVSFLTTRTVPGHELRYDATYRFATSRGDRSQNNLTTGLFGEWDRTDTRWNAFGQGRYDYDEFQSWDQRITASGGLGYRLFDLKGVNEDGESFDLFRMTGRLGGGLRQEFGSTNEDLAPEGLIGAELAYRMNGSMMLTGASTLYPDLKESGEFRLVSRLDWTADIHRLEGISLKLGLAHEYESRADPGVKHNNLSAYAALVVSF